MKIAVLCPYDFSIPGGVQTQALNLASSLKNSGHKVVLFAPLSSENQHQIKNVEFIDIGRPVKFNFLGSNSRISLNFIKIIKISNFINKNNFDVIHLHEPLSPTFLLLIALVKKTKIVGTFHAYSHKRHFWYYYFNFFLRRFIKKIDQKICVSETSKKYISKYFEEIFFIIPNGIELQKYRNLAKKTNEFSEQSKKILFVGRFEEKRKGFNILLEAFNNLSLEFNKVQLNVVGPGDPKKIKYKNKNIDFSKINFIGSVNQSDLPNYYNDADIVCLPSLENESFGVIILESMASGKILVLSDIESYKNVALKNNYGFLYDYKSSNKLAELLLSILKNEKSSERNIKNGLKNVKNYSWDYLVSEIIKIYKKSN